MTPDSSPDLEAPVALAELERVVAETLGSTPFIDMHTHLFPPAFGVLGFWGIDRLLTYHYLEAELFRSASIRPEQYWNLPLDARADLIWRTLFAGATPISEATRGVVAVLDALGLDPKAASLEDARAFFAAQTLPDHISRVLALAGVSEVVMTNDPLDPDEATCWAKGATTSASFHAALRLDRVLNEWPSHWQTISALGYAVQADAGGKTTADLRRLLLAWAVRIRPKYMAVSLPDTFDFPADDVRTTILRDTVLPACRELGLPLSLMIGVRRQINPALRLAGDGSGRADVGAVGRLCAEFPDNRFLVSILSRENQHELCVFARKFSNLRPFGCWWFLNNGSVVAEMTRMRLEMLGTTFIPQHSDARVLEQLIYKWRNTRRTLAPVLTDAYRAVVLDGRPISRRDVQQDVTRLFRTNFQEWTPA